MLVERFECQLCHCTWNEPQNKFTCADANFPVHTTQKYHYTGSRRVWKIGLCSDNHVYVVTWSMTKMVCFLSSIQVQLSQPPCRNVICLDDSDFYISLKAGDHNISWQDVPSIVIICAQRTHILSKVKGDFVCWFGDYQWFWLLEAWTLRRRQDQPQKKHCNKVQIIQEHTKSIRLNWLVMANVLLRHCFLFIVIIRVCWFRPDCPASCFEPCNI